MQKEEELAQTRLLEDDCKRKLQKMTTNVYIHMLIYKLMFSCVRSVKLNQTVVCLFTHQRAYRTTCWHCRRRTSSWRKKNFTCRSPY